MAGRGEPGWTPPSHYLTAWYSPGRGLPHAPGLGEVAGVPRGVPVSLSVPRGVLVSSRGGSGVSTYLLVHGPAAEGSCLLLRAQRVDDGAVLGAHVLLLPHAWGGAAPRRGL